MNKNDASGATTGETSAEPNHGFRIFAGKLHRVQRQHGKTFVEGPPSAPPVPVCRPARVAVMLALAHKIQDAIDRGVVRDRADAARRLGLTRARMTQLLNLTLLAPDIQEQILFAKAVDGVEPMSEKSIRGAMATISWDVQREMVRAQRAH